MKLYLNCWAEIAFIYVMKKKDNSPNKPAELWSVLVNQRQLVKFLFNLR